LSYARKAVTGRICGDGPFTETATRLFYEKTGMSNILMVSSCTHSLELAALLCGLEPGDEVILPSFTFSSTANAFILRGANPSFCEIDPRTMNIDTSRIEELITENTKAICPIDYAGVCCDIDSVNDIAKRHSLKVVLDSAQSLGSKFKGRSAGLDADYACFSFHETKNYTCGEGGAIFIKSDEEMKTAEIIREKGTDRSSFYRGEVDKYTWQNFGSSYLPSDILMAVLTAQLERFDEIKSKRISIWKKYFDGLYDLELKGFLKRPFIPEYAEHNAHIFYIILNTAAERDSLLDFLREKGVGAVFHYIPLHSSPYGKRFGYKPEDLPLTEEYSARLLRLPIFPDLADDEVEYIIDSVLQYFGGSK
jgi:dTDP-4-amino-4,6-dideoxygalactose transaminase